MTNRERMLAILRGERVDRIPFVQYRNIAAPDSELWEAFGRDSTGLLKWSNAHRFVTSQCSVTTRKTRKGDLHGDTTVIETPKGTLRQERHFSPALGSPATSRHFVRKREDLRLLLLYLRDVRVEPDLEKVAEDTAALGDDGLPLVAVARTPYQQLWVQWISIEQLAFLLADEDDLLFSCIEELTRIERQIFTTLRAVMDEIEIPLVDIPDNIHAPAIGTRYFDAYCAPLYRELVGLLAETGATVAVHMDGNLKPLWRSIGASGVHALDSFSPPPDNDTSVADALGNWPTMRLLINFPSSVHLADPEVVHETACRMLSEGGKSGQLWIQISENPPPGRWKVSLPPILKAIAEFGPVG